MSFEFTRDGVTFHVHTEVGNGPARVVVDEQQWPDPDMEPEDQDAA